MGWGNLFNEETKTTLETDEEKDVLLRRQIRVEFTVKGVLPKDLGREELWTGFEKDGGCELIGTPVS